MRAYLILATALGISTMMASGMTSAEPLPSLNLRSFQPPTDNKGSLYLEPVMTPGAGNWNLAGWGAFAYRPVVIRDANGDVLASIVRHQATVDFVGSVGIGRIASIGLSIPTILSQSGDNNDLTQRYMGNASLPSMALGDAALTGKVTIVPYGDMGGFGLAALARITAPTGARTGFAGEGAPTSELRLLGELKLIAVSLQATAGFKLRVEERVFAGRTWGNEIPWGVALAVHPQAFGLDKGGHWTWVIESHGALPAGPSSPFSSVALSPALAGVSARYAFRNVSLLGGVEAPLDSAIGLPLFRAIAAVQWAPRIRDEDHDGVEDEVDECPGLAEDIDGFEDSDGCTDFDNDNDTVADVDDKCPKQAEDLDEYEDEDGCPDPDNDKDSVTDTQDACPNVAGPTSTNPKQTGCPLVDSDGDGILDALDKCPKIAEDKDGHQDGDGCPDLDNDGDGIEDAQDACPEKAGVADADPKRKGCPASSTTNETVGEPGPRTP